MYFITIENFNTKIIIREKKLSEIEVCKKIDNENILIKIPKSLFTIKIIDNKDYMIIHQYNFLSKYYDFNSNLDLIYIEMKNEGNYYNI